jgi:hypothetical protein
VSRPVGVACTHPTGNAHQGRWRRGAALVGALGLVGILASAVLIAGTVRFHQLCHAGWAVRPLRGAYAGSASSTRPS